MPKTKESIAAYNKEYFSRPEVIARAKVRNAKYRTRRQEYKKTEAGIVAERHYRQTTRIVTAQRNRLKRQYGLTPEGVQAMKDAQLGLCAICFLPPKHWHIDHNHETNKVRGMLCGPCNLALGLLKDDSKRIRRAAQYIDVNNI